MSNLPGLGGILGIPPIHVIAYVAMTVLAVKAIFNVGGVLHLRRRFRHSAMPAKTDPELAVAVKSAQSSGSLLPMELALSRIFDPVMDRCERGLFYCPSFGLIFTVIGGLLAILSSVGSGHFDRNAMIEGIGMAMATTAIGFLVALFEYWSLKSLERIRDSLFAELAGEVTLSPPAAEGAVS